jgi:Type II secretory pathway, component ExeA (predicted ATPase)
LPPQREIHDTLKVHCQQGGLCLILGVPGTGKSVIKQSLQRLPESQYLVATVARTLHTYTNTVKILCEPSGSSSRATPSSANAGSSNKPSASTTPAKPLTTILDDAHLMDLANLRKLRLLFEDFPKNHNLVLIGRPSLLAALDLGVNQDIKSRSPTPSSPSGSTPTTCATSCCANSTAWVCRTTRSPGRRWT